jgi:NADPH:quinone reductase
MRAQLLTLDDAGPRMELREIPDPKPGPGELLVRVRATALNRGEFIRGSRVSPVQAGDSGRPCGMEAAGEVVGLGDGATGFPIGTRVMGRAKAGMAELTLIDTREAMRVPEHMNWEQAAATPIVFLVGYDMVVAGGDLQQGESLLVTGVTSGVGIACVQMAHALGATTIGTSGSTDKLATAKKFGLDHGITTRAPDFAEEVKRLTDGKGANLAINNVGGSVFPEMIRALAYMGRLAMVGYVDRQMKAEIDLEALHTQRLKLFGVSNKLRTAAQRAATVSGFVRDMLPRFASGEIKPAIDRVYAFTEMQAAVEQMIANNHVGKIVVTV